MDDSDPTTFLIYSIMMSPSMTGTMSTIKNYNKNTNKSWVTLLRAEVSSTGTRLRSEGMKDRHTEFQ